MLGTALAALLHKAGVPVRLLDINASGKTDGLETIVGDICDPDTVARACRGMETVFHTAAAVWNPGTPPETFDRVNVGGTRNVIEACIAASVRRLVFTSTMDVVVDGDLPICGGDETLPYPVKTPKDHYSRTKIISERDVIAANGESGLLTCSIRPVGMYGPGDRYHLPNIIAMARSRFNIKLGDGSARFSHVFSENVAHGHIMAAENLYPGSPVCGQCYFITDNTPEKNLFSFMEPFLRKLGLPVPTLSIPYRLAYLLSALAELIDPKTKFTRFAVVQTCVDHTFVSAKAERDFGYLPPVSEEEAFEKTMQWLREEGYRA